MTSRDIIAGLSGNPMSGLWTLHFESGRSILISSGFGVRQLAACFGATEGTGDLLEKIAGQDIVYSTDDLLELELEAFTPTEEWIGPEIAVGEILSTDDLLARMNGEIDS